MRRVGLLALVLLMLSLTTAFAASFDVQAEDIASFTTPVSISVPDSFVIERTFYLKDANTPGTLADEPESDSKAVQGATIDPDSTTSLQNQTGQGKFFEWQTLALPADLELTNKAVELSIYQNAVAGGGDGTITAGIFSCDSQNALASTVGCALIAESTSTFAGNGEQTIRFPENPPSTLSTAVIPQDSHLRLKITNQSSKANQKWSVQWGYKTNRPARLEILGAAG